MYRDLKPKNIGLDRDNNAKIYDFGLSKELRDEMKVKSEDGNEGYDKYMATQMMVLHIFLLSCIMGTDELRRQDDMSCFADLASQVYTKKCRPVVKRHWPKEIKRLLQMGWHDDPSKRPEAMEFCDELQICMRQRILSTF